MAHDLASLITVLDGILCPTDQIPDNHSNPLVKSFAKTYISLKNVVKKSAITVHDRIRHFSIGQEDRIIDVHNEPLLKSLLEKATSLKNLLEESVMQHRLRGNSNSGNKEIMETLQGEIRDAAQEAEDIIESHAMGVRTQSSEPYRSVRQVIEKFDAANDKLMKIIIDYQSHEAQTSDAMIDPSSLVEADPEISEPNIAMVGFDDDALHIKDRLTSQRRQREIIPIVGMGGIGKTTLARNLYSDPLIVSHFENHRAWVTVSQDYNRRAILLGLLGCLFGKKSDHMQQQDDIELGLTLYQRLYGRRYLIVLDDIWSEKFWDEVKHCFPNENNGSRILITSRELDVAKYPDPSCEEHRMHLLSSVQGWDLLRQKVFDAEKAERCPPFLEEVGRKIVKDCGGLPLAICVIGGLLSANKYSKDLWEQVARDVSSVLSHEDEHFSKILSLSYDNLPLHLKPCFLYMSAFPEDFEVKGSKLVKLWIAEGFLWRSGGKNKSLEDVGEEYLKALVDRNLLSIADTYYVGRAKSYSMHDLLRDLCMKKAVEEKFLCVSKNEKVNSFRRVSIHLFSEDAPTEVEHLSLSRSLLVCIDEKYHMINISPILSTLSLLRVLDMHNIAFKKFPRKVLKLINLRFLAITFRGTTPSDICRLRNLQTLIIGFTEYLVRLPYKAWEILSLRHLIVEISTICIDFKITRVQENLQEIRDVRLCDLLASNLINSMPNVRKLGICDEDMDFEDSNFDLCHLLKLETLKFNDFTVGDLSRIKLPNCLRKVSLFLCKKVPMRLFDVLGTLENLEVLKIHYCRFVSDEQRSGADDDKEEEWELHEGVEFRSLQYLWLNDLEIVRWKADESHFPRLRHLKFVFCKKLEDLPASIGEISTLEMIDVDDRNHPSLLAWAKEIQETQRIDYGNETLQVHIDRMYR